MRSDTASVRHERSFASLGSRSAWRLALVLAVGPNLLMLAAMPFFVAVRPLSPLLYLAAGLIALRLKPVWASPLLLVAATLDLGTIVAIAFHLPLATAIESARYMASIDITASFFYVATVILFIANALVVTWFLNRNRATLRGAAVFPAVAVTVCLMAAEHRVNLPFMKQAAPSFESALSMSGLDSSSITAEKRNLMLVLVEGLGAYADPSMASLLEDRLKPAVDSGHFDLVHGLNNFQGSTTGAEARELCGLWADHTDFLGGGEFDCLPRRLAAQGYSTVSFHGFSHTMFSRDRWYPRIGFDESHFFEGLAPDTTRFPSRCGSVFEGLCDTEVAHAVRERLKQDDGKPKLVYWLTLNSHIPYVPKSGGQLRCGSEHAGIENKRVCELTELWADVFDSVVAIARDPELPPTDILIVGDHSTPLWERPAAALFRPGKVQWYLLRSKQEPV